DPGTGVSPARLSALSVIVYGNGVTMTQLAAAEQVRLPTMSRLVSAMEHEGLVTRTPIPEDGRAVMVTATKRGREVLQLGRRLRLTALESALDQCSAREREAIAAALPALEELFAAKHAAPR